MDGDVASRGGAKASVARLIRGHPGVALLVLAVLVGLFGLPAAAELVKDHDVRLNGQVSLVHLVWLVLALGLAIVLLASRGSLLGDLSEGMRRLLAGAEPSPTTATHGAGPDVPAHGVAIVRGIFDLVLLLVIQGIVRVPLVAVASGYAPKPTVDGGFVVVVFLIALLMLVGLYRLSQPLTVHLVSSGLDRLIPTAGFAAASLPEVAGRLPTRPATGAGAREEPTVAAAAEATVAAAAERTVAAEGDVPTWSAEATVAAPGEPIAAAEATIAEPVVESGAPNAGVVESGEATVVERVGPSESARAPRPAAGDATVVEETVVERAPSATSEGDPGRSDRGRG